MLEATLELETKRSELEDAQGLLEARRTEWVRDRQEAETKREALRQQYAEVSSSASASSRSARTARAPRAAARCGEHYRTVLEHLDEQIETVNVDGNYYKARVEQLERDARGRAAARRAAPRC